ncbi:aminoglycoside phosphotransferase family protein [Bacillus sp. 2205SS5-2]|uniref:aminoglycoside phosphotransferase family protein n=1 Tax=Bacillus sp. 2205SS5-2 TaxID=3109031 RepID=UPI003006F866
MELGSPVAVGNTAKVYLYNNKIYKVFNEALSDMESQKEAYKQKYAYSCGLAVPEVFDVTRIDNKQVIIMEYVKGRTIGDLVINNRGETEYYMNLSVDIQRKIHQIEANSIEFMSDKISRQVENAPLLDSKIKSILIKKMELISFEERLCHGDYHLFNLIMFESKVSVIDWVDSSAGDLRADVYRTYLLYSQVSLELAEMYLRLYCEKSGLSRDEIFQWAPIIAAARLSESVSSEKTQRLIEIIDHNVQI